MKQYQMSNDELRKAIETLRGGGMKYICVFIQTLGVFLFWAIAYAIIDFNYSFERFCILSFLGLYYINRWEDKHEKKEK